MSCIYLGIVSCVLPRRAEYTECRMANGNYQLTHQWNLDGAHSLPVYCVLSPDMVADFAKRVRGTHRHRFVANAWLYAQVSMPAWLLLDVLGEHHQSDTPQLKIYGPGSDRWSDGRYTLYEIPNPKGSAVATISKA